VLDANLFGSLSVVREAVHLWMTEYIEEPPPQVLRQPYSKPLLPTTIPNKIHPKL
jgi:hypothetical protein